VSNRGGAGYNVASSTAHNTSGVHHVFFRKKKLKTSAGFTNVSYTGGRSTYDGASGSFGVHLFSVSFADVRHFGTANNNYAPNTLGVHSIS
jgi:hypothetical protein